MFYFFCVCVIGQRENGLFTQPPGGRENTHTALFSQGWIMENCSLLCARCVEQHTENISHKMSNKILLMVISSTSTHFSLASPNWEFFGQKALLSFCVFLPRYNTSLSIANVTVERRKRPQNYPGRKTILFQFLVHFKNDSQSPETLDKLCSGSQGNVERGQLILADKCTISGKKKKNLFSKIHKIFCLKHSKWHLEWLNATFTMWDCVPFQLKFTREEHKSSRRSIGINNKNSWEIILYLGNFFPG